MSLWHAGKQTIVEEESGLRARVVDMAPAAVSQAVASPVEAEAPLAVRPVQPWPG